MDKWRQQEVHDDEDQKILVGQNYLVDKQKWNDNQFIKFDTQQRRRLSKQKEDPEELKYRTFSKRSFRPDFVDPTDNRGVVWFVDTANGGEGEEKRTYSGPPVRSFNRKPVTRNDTFRMDREEREESGNRRSINDPIRVEIKNGDSGVKVVPVGVANPFNSQTRADKIHSPFATNEPIKIYIDRSNNSAPLNGQRSRGSPPPPYTQQNTNKSPQRTFSSSTVVIGGDDDNGFTRRTVTTQEFSRKSDRKSGVEDVLSAVRAPNSHRPYNNNSIPLQQNLGNRITVKQRQTNTFSPFKVKPAWR